MMPLISSFWSQPLWARELPPTHGSRVSHFSLTSGACHGMLQPLTPWFNQELGDPGWEYRTGAGPKQAMNGPRLLCDLRPPACLLWATHWKTSHVPVLPTSIRASAS